MVKKDMNYINSLYKLYEKERKYAILRELTEALNNIYYDDLLPSEQISYNLLGTEIDNHNQGFHDLFDDLKKNRKCGLFQPYEINFKELKKSYDKEFYNYNILTFIECIFDKINLNLIKYPFIDNFYVTHYIKNHIPIFQESAFGNTYISDLGDFERALIIKTPKKSSLLRELLIGKYGTNSLRKYIPNFSYLYGYIECSLPLFGNQNNVCLNIGEKNLYLFYEFIEGISLKNYIELYTKTKTINYKIIEEILSQIFLSLELAYEKIDFTHYDLHIGNIMIKELKNPVSIHYKTSRHDLYVNSQYIPIFIDYGMCHIRYAGKNIGTITKQINIKNSSNPIYDVFKILGFLKNIVPFTTFFGNEYEFTDNYFSYFGNRKFNDFMNYFLGEVTQNIITSKPRFSILNCDMGCVENVSVIERPKMVNIVDRYIFDNENGIKKMDNLQDLLNIETKLYNLQDVVIGKIDNFDYLKKDILHIINLAKGIGTISNLINLSLMICVILDYYTGEKSENKLTFTEDLEILNFNYLKLTEYVEMTFTKKDIVALEKSNYQFFMKNFFLI